MQTSTSALKLIDTSDVVPEIQPEYLALSYCWGSAADNDLMTTMKNLSSHLDNIDETQAPATIRDALKVTRMLGIQYLWVDSLCIIQDDYRDKAREIARMEDYYSNAFATIIVTSALSASEGFLVARTPTNVDIETCLLDGTLGTLRLAPDFRNSETTLRGDDYPQEVMQILKWPDLHVRKKKPQMSAPRIHSRGWTLQEKLLSACKISFNNNSIGWECQEGYKGYVVGFGDTRYEKSTYSGSQENDPPPFNFSGDKDYRPSFHTLVASWTDIVKEYTKRNLTVASDKALAISALARGFNSVTGDTYLAGLWMSWLGFGLSWKRQEQGRDWLSDTIIGPGLQADNTAPTWSWLSLKGPVEMADPQPHRSIVALIDHTVELADPINPWGRVKLGRLVLDGLVKRLGRVRKGAVRPSQRVQAELLKARRAWEKAGTDCDDGILGLELDISKDEEDAFYKSSSSYSDEEDADELESDPKGLYKVDFHTRHADMRCIGLWKPHHTKPAEGEKDPYELSDEERDLLNRPLMGLIIARSDSEQDFRRIGIFYADDEWMQDAEQQSISLI